MIIFLVSSSKKSKAVDLAVHLHIHSEDSRFTLEVKPQFIYFLKKKIFL